MEHYPTDTASHYEPGAELEIRYFTVREWIPDDVTVLEIGCNSGGLGKRLMRDRRVTMYGVEPNRALACKAYCANYAHVWIGMIEDVAQRISPMDVVLGMNPLEYCIDLDVTMQAMLVPLKPGGVFINEGVHKAGRWGSWYTHTDLTHSWDARTSREFFEQYIDITDVLEVGIYDDSRDWVYVRGVKR